MRAWVRLLLNEGRALSDAMDHLESLARQEDSLSKATDLEKLHYQRGKVAGINDILFILKQAKEK